MIVSDSIGLSFEDVIDYKKIEIFVESNTALKPGFLVMMLREIISERILEYQKKLNEKLISHEEEQCTTFFDSNFAGIGVDAMRVRHDDVPEERALVQFEPTEITDEQHRVFHRRITIT